MKIGVLALQGAVAEHVRMLEEVGATAVPVKKVEELDDLDGLIIPGGESTTISKLMHKYGFMEAVQEFGKANKPIFGTCAGAILLAKRIQGQDDCHLGLMDIKVERNAFGRQKESFEVLMPVAGVAADYPAVFIRAPYIMEVGENGQVLAKHEDKIVVARNGHYLAAAFHPELTEDTRLHKYFLDMVKEYRS
ncbi:pyridoxal 5'-phosphate synthase glutaminase subunit PdxT [Brevibacillus formosus]|uniref:Pyridoxal 5'-phosphate synthase subunit PdxT n=1 Tax=Brevibacillus formosus TaxID=54913 RepID=A0A837KFV5_9BACL|nr:pyridoxal 5'-phosphate synthase glutaminase subunit PdxT [Brevibacillus formosus]KLH96073.1 glutamine amidotransferase [Brevibacillus formosus]MED1955603.1 pyridoxal 5'-phosphate synthase glutaminase subunit PdxT [Brevibacillus formosus]PSJ97769.1 pyridoxal 5'-phosphate synthase glutaminase subunit PdxT [Brevibacillus formosus]GED60475.1 pyridoxal 5'-phosphate synthase subunit PdxT [Brevibacillus formosus]